MTTQKQSKAVTCFNFQNSHEQVISLKTAVTIHDGCLWGTHNRFQVLILSINTIVVHWKLDDFFAVCFSFTVI